MSNLWKNRSDFFGAHPCFIKSICCPSLLTLSNLCSLIFDLFCLTYFIFALMFLSILVMNVLIFSSINIHVNLFGFAYSGMTNSTFYPCPTGHYCEEATTYPEPCTGGRMSPTEGRVSNEDCPLCDPGYFCPNDTLNVYGIPCDPSYECPEGT